MLTDFAKKLISIASTRENNAQLHEVITCATEDLKGFTIEHFERDSVPSVLVYSDTVRPEKFKVILNAHLDVVPALESQFHPVEKDGYLYGRGAIDMKAAAAVEILVFKELAKTLSFPVGLQLVTDEEIGGFNGTKLQTEKGVRADFVIAGEPTNFGINTKAKGILWLKVIAKGVTAHGAYPWQGKNALLKLEKFLSRLIEKFPEPTEEVWKTTVNLSRIETRNRTNNKVPDDAVAILDVRFVPEDALTILETIHKLGGGDVEFEVLENEPPQFTDEKDVFVDVLKKAVADIMGEEANLIVKHGGSDVRHFNAVGCAGVTFGPIGSGLHTDDEKVLIKSLEQYSDILKKFLLSL
jgi:succinyl-diaminopimelate desuccinylase